MGQNRLTLLFKYQIGLNIEFESDLNRINAATTFLSGMNVKIKRWQKNFFV